MNKRRNFAIFTAAVAVFGATFGIYEVLIPFYLQSRQISFALMGGIFAVSFLVAFLMRQYAGYLSDRMGRKPFFSLAFFLCGLGNFGTPLFATASSQAFLKSLREGAFSIKETMQATIIYENDRENFLNLYGRNRGTEWLFQAVGALLAGVIVAFFSLPAAFYFSGTLLFITGFLFAAFFQVTSTAFQASPRSPREVFTFDLTGRMRFLTFIYFVINVNTGLAHGPTLPLFFRDRFGMSVEKIAVLMFVHRIALGLPMFLVGRLKFTRLKEFYLFSLAISGVALFITPFIPAAAAAIPVWLCHDLIGAGIYIPIHNYLAQHFAGEDIRGLHVAKSFAYGSLGTVLGVWLSGYLYTFDIGGPFLASGICAFLACLLLVRL